MRGRRHRRGMEVNGEINVVSLIDVMMLLMVIFMITAPLMQGGVEVSLPKVDAPALESKSSLVVSLSRSGQITVGKAKMNRAEFARSFQALAASKGKDGVYLQGDASVPYGDILELFVMMQKGGVTNVYLVTEPPGGDGIK